MKESSFYSDDFEQLIREKTEQYKMYPSEKVWKGVHNSLHTRRRWFIGSMALLVTGILFLAGRELIAPSNHAIALRKAAKGSTTDFATKPPLAENIPHAPLTAFHSPATAAAANVRRNATAGNTISEDQDPAYRGISITLSNPVINPSDLSEWLSKVVQLPDRAPDLAVIAVRTPAADAGKTPDDATRPGARTGAETTSREAFEDSRESIDETGADGLTARGVLESLSARGAEKARNARMGGHLANNKTNGNVVTADGKLADAGAANASASAIAEAEDRQRVNWLQDYAMNTLPAPSRRGRTFFQLSLAPTLNYRVMGGLDPSIEKVGGPTPYGFTVLPGDRMNHSAAFGFEFGGSILYRLTRNLSVKGGLQFNFARYRITAFNNPQLGATYSYYGYMIDSATRGATTQQASSAGGFGPVTQETLKNDYFQLSAPVGFELRVLGNERLQFNLGASVQPSYLLGTSSYILSQDKATYSKEPDMYRKFNVYGGVEAFLSYRVGNLRWQIGPEFRYQLISSYSSQTPITENLKSYGIKIGITKMLP